MPKTREQAAAEGWGNAQRARAFIKQKYSHFYRILLGLIPKDVPDIGTLFVTDKMMLGIDMAWFSTLPVDVAAGCLIHEVSHILRDRSRMRVLENQDRANIAFDIPINDDLKKFEIKLPDWALYSSTYGFKPGLTGEAYYELLTNLPPPPNGGGVCAGKCGSCADHGKDPVPATDGRTEKEVQYYKKIGAQDIRDFVKAKGMKAGDIPGSWKEFLTFDDEVPVVPWQHITRSAIGKAFGSIKHGHSDFSMRRPAKRSYTAGIIRPGLIDYMPTVFFIEDSSLSMGSKQLKENRVEAVSAMMQLGLEEIWFLNADTKVQTTPRKIRAKELLTLPVVGRGGTTFIPAIEAALTVRPRPDFIFYSTDGEGRAPEHKPRGVEFVWLLAPGPHTRSPCNWGIQILTTNDPGERKKFQILQ